MYNTLLNRYYLSNASRYVAPASGAAVSLRGKAPHQARSEELQGLWLRYVSLTDSDMPVQILQPTDKSDQSQNFCGKTN